MIVSNVSLSCGVSCPWEVSDSKTVVTQGGGSGSLSPTGHLVVAVCLGFIGTFGFLNNLLVLTLFCRYRTLRTPINVLLLSVCVSDLLVCVLGTPFSFAAATQGRWLIGRAGCVWYGFINSCLGIVSLISLAVLSYERCCTMLCRTQADGTDFGTAVAGTPNNISYIVCLFIFCLLLPFSVILYSYGKLLSAIKQ
ncbi:unnamed protein product, partial [Coregonus sp. 'balchen']